MRAAGPLLFLWLAVHAVLLGLILGIKFLSAKTMVLLFLIGSAFWLLSRRKDVPSLPAPSRMGNEARV